MSYATSPAKANHLFCLGRYAERVYTTLALLRSSRDGETDGNRGAVACCFARLGCPLEYGCTEEQAILRFLYDPELAGSLRQSLESAYENSIVLREDLSTESLRTFISAGNISTPWLRKRNGTCFPCSPFPMICWRSGAPWPNVFMSRCP